MAHAANWFEIPTADLPRAQGFYETVLQRKLRREQFGPFEIAVFPHGEDGAGGCLWSGAGVHAPGGLGTLVYLDCMPSIDAALARVEAADGRVVMPRQALPPGMGFIAHVLDPEGNKVGLHALA
jgi:predicted enzyme related to lactoylglutathione lyase